jgi:hypothetical protein
LPQSPKHILKEESAALSVAWGIPIPVWVSLNIYFIFQTFKFCTQYCWVLPKKYLQTHLLKPWVGNGKQTIYYAWPGDPLGSVQTIGVFCAYQYPLSRSKPVASLCVPAVIYTSWLDMEAYLMRLLKSHWLMFFVQRAIISLFVSSNWKYNWCADEFRMTRRS